MACKRPGVGVGVFVTSKLHDNCILLGIRRGSSGSGLYALPGGHLEFGEEWAECAYREVMEETGLRIKNVGFATVVNDALVDKGYHYITIFMKGEVDSEHSQQEPINMEPEKCECWQWIRWDEFPSADNLFWPLKTCIASGYNPFS